jgi:hypothetical protein
MISPSKKARNWKRKRQQRVQKHLNGKTHLGDHSWDVAIDKYIATGELDAWNLPGGLYAELRKYESHGP